MEEFPAMFGAMRTNLPGSLYIADSEATDVGVFPIFVEWTMMFSGMSLFLEFKFLEFDFVVVVWSTTSFLSGWLFFHSVGNVISSQLTFTPSFFRGVAAKREKPPTSYSCWLTSQLLMGPEIPKKPRVTQDLLLGRLPFFLRRFT